MHKKGFLQMVFWVVFLLVIPSACNSVSSNPATDNETLTNKQTPTNTPDGSFQSTPDPGDSFPNQGTLSIDFVDALVQELCVFELPFTLEWTAGQGLISGETEASCLLSAIQCGDACVTMHSDWELVVSLAGTVYFDDESAPEGEIHADLVFSGILMNYASDWPEGAIPAFTIEQPFIMEQPGLILPLVLPLKVGANTSIAPEGGGEPMNVTLQTLAP